jgi:hypothetical protein
MFDFMYEDLYTTDLQNPLSSDSVLHEIAYKYRPAVFKALIIRPTKFFCNVFIDRHQPGACAIVHKPTHVFAYIATSYAGADLAQRIWGPGTMASAERKPTGIMGVYGL